MARATRAAVAFSAAAVARQHRAVRQRLRLPRPRQRRRPATTDAAGRRGGYRSGRRCCTGPARRSRVYRRRRGRGAGRSNEAEVSKFFGVSMDNVYQSLLIMSDGVLSATVFNQIDQYL